MAKFRVKELAFIQPGITRRGMDIWLNHEGVEQWDNNDHHGKKGASHINTLTTNPDIPKRCG